jgi:glutaredoxin
MTAKPKVKAYTLSTCPYCRAFKMFCAEEGVELDYTDVDLLEGKKRDAVMDEVDKVCPNCGYPIIVVGDKVIEGFNEPKLRKVLGK